MNDISREQAKWAMHAWDYLNQRMGHVLNEAKPDPEVVR